MNKFDFQKYQCLADIPLAELDKFGFSAYVLDFNWDYLFVNSFVGNNLGANRDELIGKNMWKQFQTLAHNHSFKQMKANAEKGLDIDFITSSPLTSQRIHIKGRKLQDCYLFTSSILPQKEKLLHELRSKLRERKEEANI